MSIIAKTLRRPFYVAVESYKFARMYPLSQTDVANMCEEPLSGSCCKLPFTRSAWANDAQSVSEDALDEPSSDSPSTVVLPQQPVIDFTPAEYISLLFTDLGILTPAAVSDELIRLYQ